MVSPEILGFGTTDIAFLFLVLLFAGVVRGVVGFAFPMIAMPLIMIVVDPKVAIVAFIVPNVATNGQVLVQDGVPRSFVRSHWALLSAVALGTVIGAVGLAVIPVNAILAVMSAYLVFYLWFSRYGGSLEAYATKRGMSAVIGSLTGFLGGSIGMAAPPIVTYLHARSVTKDVFVPVLAMIFLGIQFVRVPPMFVTGLLGAYEAVLGISFLLPSMLGTYFGVRVRPYISQRRFEVFVEVLLFLLAVQLGLDSIGIQLR